MPRVGRLHIPGGYYHVISRGLERRFIFETDVDKNDFLVRLGKGLSRTNTRCLAWALMSNHFHLLIQVSDVPLARLMASVLSGYANCYNRRHTRCGYVYQNRYKSILIEADSYFKELVRYIHLNPVRAGMVDGLAELDSYAWTGHAGMLGKHLQGWHSTHETLQFFGDSPGRARRAYIRFLGEVESKHDSLNGGGLIRSHGGWQGLARLRREHSICIGDERILGSTGFVESALRQDDLSTDLQTTLLQRGWDSNKLAQWVCARTDVSLDHLTSKARGGNLAEAKSILCYLGSSELGLRSRELADFLSISQPSVSAWVRKGEALCKTKGISLSSIEC